MDNDTLKKERETLGGYTCWMRRILVELYTENGDCIQLCDNYQRHTISVKDGQRNYDDKISVVGEPFKDNLHVKIDGEKYPASNQDKGHLTIYNLDYSTILEIINGEYYGIRIYVGYQTQGDNIPLIFDGAVSYISNKIHDHHDTECYIAYASKLVANWSQARMNLALNSSINVYSAIKMTLMRAGINPSQMSIDETLKNYSIDNTSFHEGKVPTVLDSVQESQKGGVYQIATDAVLGTVVDVTSTKGKRKIKLDGRTIPIGSGNPRVTTEGLVITLLPVYNYRIGDILEVDNSIIDISTGDSDVSQYFNPNYMDSNGMYMIYHMSYSFDNFGDAFSYNIKARSLEITYNLTGTKIA